MMNRWEFMRQLEELLSDISPNEREEALQYYNDYFNDAGKENEQEVLKALGSPWQVAKTVKVGLGENGNLGEFTENGFTSAKEGSRNAIVKRNGEGAHEGAHEEAQREGGGESGTQNRYAGEKNVNGGNSSQYESVNTGRTPENTEKKENMPTWAIVMIVIVCVIFSPVILSALCAAAGIFIGVITAIIGTILGFSVATVVLYIVAIALWVAGIGCILTHPIAGIGLLGGGCLCAALGILFMLLVAFLAGKCIPGICQGIAYIFKKLFGKTGGAEA